jgi:hypothetical protein
MVLEKKGEDQWVRITLRLLKYGPGEGRRRPVGPIVREMKKYHKQSRRRGISHIQ